MSTLPAAEPGAVFPKDFVWGVATNAFQIEGAAAADGKGPSIRDSFCATPGSIADGSNGDVACAHYQCWSDDLDLIQGLGVDAYRFSVSWPRVRPGGAGTWYEQGMHFYDRLVDGLIAREITDMGWEVYPEGLTELLLRLHRDHAVPPLYVTENGGAFKDALVNGRIPDTQRVDNIAGYIAAVAGSMRQGVRMEGYMVWRLLDNFEWASGDEKRIGVVHVDHATQRRTLNNSALWCRDFLQQQKAARAPREAGAPGA